MTGSSPKLSTRYALSVAALLTFLILFVLLLLGYFVYDHTGKLRDELKSSFSSVYSANTSQLLSDRGSYLSSRLFKPLYSQNISELNNEIDQINNWLEPKSIFILDSAGRVVTDGTDENVLQGKPMFIPEGLKSQSPIIGKSAESKALYFAIEFDEEIAGYAFIEISSINDSKLLASLQQKVDNTWQAFKNHFLIIAVSGLALIILISMILARRLAVSLSQPVQAMTEATEQFASGNLAFKLPEVSGAQNELTRLVLSLNEMAGELAKAEEELVLLNEQTVANEARFRAMTSQSTEGITVADPDGNYTFVNDAFCNMVGYSEQELLQMTVFDVKAPEQNTSSFAHSKTSKEGHPIQVLLQRKNGTVFNSEVIGKNIEINGEQSVLGTIRDITEQVQAEKRLVKSEQNLAQAQKIAQLGSWELDIISNELSWSAETFRIFEIDPEKFDATYDTFVDCIHPDDREFVNKAYNNSIKDRKAYDIEHRLQMKDDKVKYVNERCETYYDDNGNATRSVGTVIDITDRKLAEQTLRRSQKMDAVGQMAGGIAHDFNNILGIILGNLHLLEKQLDHDVKAQKRIDDIKHSAQRAANLTRQLLGFSRRQATREKATSINLLIAGMSSLITQSLTPQVEVEQQFAKGLWKTSIDPGDFEEALLNLVLNARDAMNGRGQLTIETCNTVLDNAYCTQNPGARPGEYVQLTVSDNGQGITSELQDRIFEPFFTTKEQGNGTGLGLAMVFGFVKRSGGYIELYSEPGIGTTFRVYLPRLGQEQKDDANTRQSEALPQGNEFLLIVDDVTSLAEIAEESLQSLGYQVLTANNGKQALEQLANNPGIDLLFSDVVMPGGINGFELAEQAKANYPKLKILLTSGYSEKVITRNGQARFETNLLNKPYTQNELAQRVRSLLDEPE